MRHDTNNQKWLLYPIMINQVYIGLLTDGLKPIISITKMFE